MNLEKIKQIKNSIKQIWNEPNIQISNIFPHEGNMSNNTYRKCWLATIFIDICGYTNFCEKIKIILF